MKIPFINGRVICEIRKQQETAKQEKIKIKDNDQVIVKNKSTF